VVIGHNVVFAEVSMHVVVIYNWKEQTEELVQAISIALGITVFEVNQRMIGGSPVVLACFADPQQAWVLVEKLKNNDIVTLVVDVPEVRSRTGQIIVRRFELNESSLRIETGDGKGGNIPYGEIDLLLPATSSVKSSDTKTVSERKLSIGKTLIAGGIPMTKKVEHQEDVESIKHHKVLYLFVKRRKQPVVFSQNGMTYDGLGTAMQISGALNFSYLVNELHRLCPRAAYDDRLTKRFGQARLLGPTLNPDTHLDLAVEILARSLRQSPGSDNTFVQ
jgi:hypothetical protein